MKHDEGMEMLDSEDQEYEEGEYEDLIDKIESGLHGIASAKKDQIVARIATFFKRIPQDDRNTLLYRRNVTISLPESSTAEVLFVNPMISDKKYSPLIPLWIISLRSELVDAPVYEFLYTLAHEMAHVFLEHALCHNTGGDDVIANIWAVELAADEKVIEWGFEDELTKTPDNYINNPEKFKDQF